MAYDFVDQEVFEISARFRQTIEDRIAKLERDADYDEEQIARLRSNDHIRRQMRLVAVERAEARRMRLFLDRAKHARHVPLSLSSLDRPQGPQKQLNAAPEMGRDVLRVFVILEHRAGVEPANTGFADLRVSHFATGAR